MTPVWFRQIPNLISSLRIVLAAPIALAMLRGEMVATLVLFLVAAVSDAADGYLAKRFGWQTRIGGILDPAADKLLLATVFIVLSVLQRVPMWLMAVVVARDLIIVLGAMAYRGCVGPIAARPSIVSKANTLCQVLYIFGVIGREQFSLPPAWALLALGALTFVTTVVSGMDYVFRYGHSALREASSRRSSLPADRSRLT